MSAQNLPSETCQQIFDLLPQHTVYQCMFVCKSWNMAAIPTYNKELSLTGNKIKRLKSLLKEYKIPQIIAHGDLVRCLKVHKDDYYSNQYLGHDEFFLLLSHLSRLKVIDLESSRNYISYLDNLQEANTTSDPDFLKYLQKISVIFEKGTFNDGRPEYFSACYNFRKSITHLQLSGGFRESESFGGQSGNHLHFLPHFKNLTHISIVNDSINGGIANLSIYPIFNACPNLTNFTLKSDQPINFNPTDLKMHTISNNSSLNSTHSISSSSTQHQQQLIYLYPHCRQLKFLSLKVLYVDMKHLLSYIPPQLCTLELHISQDVLDVWVQESGTDVMAQFAKRLRLIDKWSISVNNVRDNRNTRFRLLLDTMKDMTLQDKLGKYSSFTGIATENRDLICYLTLDISQDREASYGFQASVRNGKLITKYGLHIRDDADMMLLPFFLHDTSTFSATKLPALYSLIMNIRDYRLDNNTTMYRMLKHTLYNCPRLTKFAINGYYDRAFYRFDSKLFEPLDSSNNIITSKKYQNFLATSLTSENLTQCALYNTHLSIQLQDVLNSFFYNIKLLKIFTCTFVRDDQNNIYYDFKGIRHLEKFEFDAHHLNIRHYRHVCLHIEFTNNRYEKTAVYYRCEESSSTREVSLTPITSKFIKDYSRETSMHTTIVKFRFAKIDNFTLFRTLYNKRVSSVDVQLCKTN